MGKSYEEIKSERTVEEVAEDEEAEKEVFLSKRVFNTDSSKVDLGFRRSTDMKTSCRVVLPQGRTSKEEATIEEN